MVKASALYVVIIIALVIGVLCSSLIVAAYFYRIEYLKQSRYDHLQNNVSSGVNILLTNEDNTYSEWKVLDLFNNGTDSVALKKISWGIYDVGISRAFIQKDTLFKTFSIANTIDSTKWCALYLIDEDRPLSLSGNTSVVGDAYIPKAGVTTAYVDNKAYQGDKRLIIGHKNNSAKALPPLSAARLSQFQQMLSSNHPGDTSMRKDSVNQSFLSPTVYFNFKKRPQTIANVKISGNVILLSDSTITIENTARLNNVLIFARSIVVKEGFTGSCQLFASDSINVENNCRFNYPSCLGILRFQNSGITAPQVKLTVGENSIIDGIIFTYQKTETSLKPLLSLGTGAKVTGQVYAQAILKTKDSVAINGSVFTSQFLYQNTFTIYQNYLINLTINSKALSPYYLSSDLMPVSAKKKKVLQWLESN